MADPGRVGRGEPDFLPFAGAGEPLDKGRRLAEHQRVAVDWVCADVRGYQPEVGPLQLVLIAYLQLREAELDQVLRRAAVALAPGATLLVVGHDVANLTEGTGGSQDPAVLHTPESVARSLGDLTVLRADRVQRPVAGSPRDAVDTLVRAIRPVAVGQ